MFGECLASATLSHPADVGYPQRPWKMASLQASGLFLEHLSGLNSPLKEIITGASSHGTGILPGSPDCPLLPQPSRFHQLPPMALTHLKEASVGIKTAGIQNGILPLVEAGYLCF